MRDPTSPRGPTGAELSRANRRRLTWAAVLANGLGALDVFLLLGVLVPASDPSDTGPSTTTNAILSAAFLAVALPAGTVWAIRRARVIQDWLTSEAPAGEAERTAVLRQPLEFALVSAVFWGLGAVAFTAVNLGNTLGRVVIVAVTILLGGFSTSAFGYLLAERIMRPTTARALAGDPPAHPVGPGVATRMTMAWILATGVPVLGIAAVAVGGIAGELSRTRAATASLFLAGLALAGGLLAILVAARSVSDPISAVRAAMTHVESGDFDARVPVDDGSEVGLLEAGFNRMAEGLQERERLRDLFGRHVGRDVARAAAAGEIALGGEEREVAALFVDLVGSTALAARRAPTEVVALLNAFFGVVVEVVEAHGGLVNKFEGDAALCVFGAPVARPDSEGDALRSARELRRRLDRDVPEVEFGIGVSAGRAVAGNVGAEERFEYTVIGDPVNEAARLCELAKRRPERLLASEAVVERAGDDEAAHWRFGEDVVLRGRDAATRLATAAA